MAKIHIKGGSPIRIEFEDDDGNPLDITLEKMPGKVGRYKTDRICGTTTWAMTGNGRDFFIGNIEFEPKAAPVA